MQAGETMRLPECKELALTLEAGTLTITFNRPQKRNAMNAALIREVIAVFTAVEGERSVRAIVICGSEGNFCAGGDISDMNIDAADEESAARATRSFNRDFGHMITRVNRAPQIVIALLEGAVLGGGLGLACVSDIAIADEGAFFAMPETGLGIVPAQIAPFVVTRIGLTQARRLALTGERISGTEALALGIVHQLTHGNEQMRTRLKDLLQLITRCAPGATAVTKRLLLDVGHEDLERLLDRAADEFAAAMRGEEGKEGTRAFLEKRRPRWAE